MEIEYRELDGGVRWIKLAGKLDMEGTDSIERQFTQYCAGENVFVLVDLSRVTFLSSIGIPVLVSNAKSVANRGGRLAFLSPQPNVRSILEITGVSHVIRIYNDLETAQERIKSG
jgi:anti-anti-sigma factor